MGGVSSSRAPRSLTTSTHASSWQPAASPLSDSTLSTPGGGGWPQSTSSGWVRTKRPHNFRRYYGYHEEERASDILQLHIQPRRVAKCLGTHRLRTLGEGSAARIVWPMGQCRLLTA